MLTIIFYNKCDSHLWSFVGNHGALLCYPSYITKHSTDVYRGIRQLSRILLEGKLDNKSKH